MTFTGSSIYSGITLIFNGFVFGTSIASAVYYSRVLKTNGTNTKPPMSNNTAKIMMIISIIIAIVAFLIFSWSCYGIWATYKGKIIMNAGISHPPISAPLPKATIPQQSLYKPAYNQSVYGPQTNYVEAYNQQMLYGGGNR